MDFVAVCDTRGTGATQTAAVGHHRAEEALAVAHEAARDAGVAATTELVHDVDPMRRLMAMAAEHDLLVVGSRGHLRAADIALGGGSGRAAHSCPVPILIARAPAPDSTFPGAILAASDATDRSRAAVEIAARLAGMHATQLTLVHAGAYDAAPERHELAVQAASAMELTGVEPVVVCEPGHPVEQILAIAARERPGLIVVGSSGRAGVRALGSVSERIAARASCSVLVMRGR